MSISALDSYWNINENYKWNILLKINWDDQAYFPFQYEEYNFTLANSWKVFFKDSLIFSKEWEMFLEVFDLDNNLYNRINVNVSKNLNLWNISLSPVNQFINKDWKFSLDIILDRWDKELSNSSIIEIKWNENDLELDTDNWSWVKLFNWDYLNSLINNNPSSWANLRYLNIWHKELAWSNNVLLWSLEFKIKDFSKNEYDVEIFLSDESEGSLQFWTEIVYRFKDMYDVYEYYFMDFNLNVINNAKVFKPSLKSDPNNDNVSDSLDMSLIQRYITGFDMNNTSWIDDNESWDVNCDWETNSLDMALFQRYLTWLPMSWTAWCWVSLN